MYPSPGQSFLIILQPGHAGFGIDFRRRRLCDFSIAIVSMEFIWWAPFKERIGSAGTFARVAVAVSRRDSLGKFHCLRAFRIVSISDEHRSATVSELFARHAEISEWSNWDKRHGRR